MKNPLERKLGLVGGADGNHYSSDDDDDDGGGGGDDDDDDDDDDDNGGGRMAEWAAFLYLAVMATVVMCRVRKPACTATSALGKERYVNG